MQFTTGCVALSVSAVGRIYVPGNTGTHVVKLVLASTGLDVPGGSATVSFNGAIANQIMYAPLAAPVTLAANTSYYLASQEIATGDQFYDNQSIITIGAVSVGGPAATASGSWVAGQQANYSYGPVDFKFSVPGVAFPSPLTITTTASTPVPGTGITPAGYNHILVTGQSLAVGATGAPPLSVTQPYSNLMLNSNYSAFVPLTEPSLETPAASIGNTMTRLSGLTFTDIVTDSASSAILTHNWQRVPRRTLTRWLSSARQSRCR